jgi:hypothetical protein
MVDLAHRQGRRNLGGGGGGGGGGAGGAAAPVALYQEGQGGQRCPVSI